MNKTEIQEIVEKVEKACPAIKGAELETVLDKIASKHQSPYEAIGLDEKFLEVSYAHAYSFYQAGKYDQALGFFTVLQTLAPLDPRFLLGIALCYEQKKEWAMAFELYLMLFRLDTEDPRPLWSAYLCLEKLGEKELSIGILGYYYTLAKENLEYEDEAEKAEKILTHYIANFIKQKSAEEKK